MANSVQASHPTIWKLIESLKDEITLCEQWLDRANLGETPKRKETYQWRDVKFKNILQKYGTINNFDYLKTIAKCLIFNRNNVGLEILDGQ